MYETLSFFKNEFINEVDEIRECIQLLDEAILKAGVSIENATSECVKNREFDKMQELTACLKEIDKIEGKISSYNSLLDPENDFTTLYEKNISSKERKKINKTEALIYDVSKSYNIDYDFTFTKPKLIELFGEKLNVKTWKDVYVIVCEKLYLKDPYTFNKLTTDEEMKTRKGRYISSNEEEVRKAYKLSVADIYLEINLSAKFLCQIVKIVMEKCNVDIDELKIYLREEETK